MSNPESRVLGRRAPRSKSGRPESVYHHGDLRRALLEAALAVSAKSGPQDISFRELARNMGVTTGAPYHHFRDKNELLVQLAKDGFSRLLKRLQTAAAQKQNSTRKIAALTEVYLQFGRDEPGYYRIMFWREVCHQQEPELQAHAAPCFDVVCTAIAESNKRLAPEQVSERAVSIWSFLHGMLVLSSEGPLTMRLAQEHEDRVAVETVNRIVAN